MRLGELAQGTIAVMMNNMTITKMMLMMMVMNYR